MKITQNISFDEIDSFYNKLNENSSIDLILPIDLNQNKFGIQSELILLFITWYRKSTGKLILNTKSDDISILESIVNKHYNFSIITLAFNRGIYNLQNLKINDLILPFIKTKIAEIESNLFWGKGDHSYIISIQKSLNPYPKAFYNNNKLRSRIDFENLTKYLITYSIKTKNKSNIDSNDLNDSIPDIGKIIYELIENTHNWSLSDFKNDDLIYGLRNLLISNHHGNSEELLKGSKDDEFLNEYITNIVNQGYSNIVEISIIDSGSGLSSKYSNKPIEDFESYLDVYQEVQNCLIKYHSSEKDSSYSRGFGLHKIMELLSKKNGFLKLRTNGLKLYRNFNSYKFNDSDYTLNNYFEQNSEYNFKEYLNQGTMFTFFIPLK